MRHRGAPVTDTEERLNMQRYHHHATPGNSIYRREDVAGKACVRLHASHYRAGQRVLSFHTHQKSFEAFLS